MSPFYEHDMEGLAFGLMALANELHYATISFEIYVNLSCAGHLINWLINYIWLSAHISP